MATMTLTPTLVAAPVAARRPSVLAAVATLSARRFALSVRTPRELVVPLLTPVLFALVIAPVLQSAFGGAHNGVDYMSFVALATVGLLIPLNTQFAGLCVIIDRLCLSGAQRELPAAPIPRALLVVGNIVVVTAITALQLTVLLVLAAVRGAQFHITPSGMAWFAGAALLFTVGMYGIAEALASRMGRQEEYISATPAVAIVPWFFAGTLFPISVLPGFLEGLAKVLPLTHALAVVRYGFLGAPASGLHEIWGGSNPTTMAAVSLGVVALFTVVGTALAIRSFSRKAVR